MWAWRFHSWIIYKENDRHAACVCNVSVCATGRSPMQTAKSLPLVQLWVMSRGADSWAWGFSPTWTGEATCSQMQMRRDQLLKHNCEIKKRKKLWETIPQWLWLKLLKLCILSSLLFDWHVGFRRALCVSRRHLSDVLQGWFPIPVSQGRWRAGNGIKFTQIDTRCIDKALYRYPPTRSRQTDWP